MSTTTKSQTVKKTIGSFSAKMSASDATALSSDPNAKEAFAKAFAAALGGGLAADNITITAIYVNGVKVGRRLLPTDASIKVDYEVRSIARVLGITLIDAAKLKNQITKEAAALGHVIVITELPTVSAPVVLQAGYLFGEDFTNRCPAGGSSLSTESQCETAAGILGFRWKGALAGGVDHSWPKGCFEHMETDVYFNRNPAGKSKESAGPICRVTTTTTSSTETKTTTKLQATSQLGAVSNGNTAVMVALVVTTMVVIVAAIIGLGFYKRKKVSDHREQKEEEEDGPLLALVDHMGVSHRILIKAGQPFYKGERLRIESCQVEDDGRYFRVTSKRMAENGVAYYTYLGRIPKPSWRLLIEMFGQCTLPEAQVVGHAEEEEDENTELDTAHEDEEPSATLPCPSGPARRVTAKEKQAKQPVRNTTGAPGLVTAKQNQAKQRGRNTIGAPNLAGKRNQNRRTSRVELEQDPPKWFLDYEPEKKAAVEACFATIQSQLWAFTENDKAMKELSAKWGISSKYMGDLAIYFGAQHLKLNPELGIRLSSHANAIIAEASKPQRKSIAMNAKEIKKWDVFISYSSCDSDTVCDMLLMVLTMMGLKVFNAKRDLAGAKVTASVMRANAADSKVVLAIVSPNYFLSKWCRGEIEAADENSVPVVPVFSGQDFALRIIKTLMQDSDETHHKAIKIAYKENLIDINNPMAQEIINRDIREKIVERFCL